MNQSRAATTIGTSAYKNRFSGIAAAGHFRQSQDLWMSSIGLGSYLGEPDEPTDEAYRNAVRRAVELGCNVFDTAANYRFQRSERSFGDAFSELFSSAKLARDEVIVTTKGGYIPFESRAPRSRQEISGYIEETFIKTGVCRGEDFVQGSHCMEPAYLAHQLDQSLRNLKLDCIDVYYLHNPESQLAEISSDDFYKRLRAAFEFLESAVEAGKISMYGAATWNGFRVPSGSPEFLSLEKVVKTAIDAGGSEHRFKVIQLPFNLAMTEALTSANQTVDGRQIDFLEAAEFYGLTVMASASILQARLASGLPRIVSESFLGLESDAQRSIQFTRSTPGIVTALVGMSNISHVNENLAVAQIPPASPDDYLKLVDRD